MCLAASLAHHSPDLCHHPSPNPHPVPFGRVEVGSARGRPVSSAEPGVSCVGGAGQRVPRSLKTLREGRSSHVQTRCGSQVRLPRLPAQRGEKANELRAWAPPGDPHPGLARSRPVLSQPPCSGLQTPPASGQPLTRPPRRGLEGSPRCHALSAAFFFQRSLRQDRRDKLPHRRRRGQRESPLSVCRRWVGSGGEGLLPGSPVPPWLGARPVRLRARPRELCEHVAPTAQRGSV